ncbi:MAG: hypothetical protein VXW32_05775 [Myxococcota bacterium]|jgi:hypothetical protein|nr:hypothetical protein [Myxococcota bacterium]
MKALATLITVVLLSLASASAAEASTMPKNAIARGVAMGQLTVYEVKALRVQEAKIERFKRLALRDGRLSRAERAKLRQMNAKLKTQYVSFTRNRVRRL